PPFGGLVLVRFQPNGAVDGSFGSSGDGWVFTDFGAYHESATDLIPSANGGLILAGSDGSSSVTGGRNILAGYTADGIPDPTFGVNGRVVLPFSGGTDLALGPGRRFVLTGGGDFHTARFF